MIKKLNIKKLFGQFNYEIEFKNTGITIITGPNGFGKSTILKIIEALADKDLYEICQFPFEELSVSLNNDEIVIKKTKSSVVVDECQLELYSKKLIENYRRRHELPFIERIGPETYVDMRFDKVLSIDEYKKILKESSEDEEPIKDKLIAVNYETARKNRKETNKFKELDKRFYTFKRNIGEIKFIKEQRLLRQETVEEGPYYSREKRSTVIEAINEIPSKLKKEIQETIVKHSQISSQLDSTFPSRLFDSIESIGQELFLDTFAEIILRQEKLQSYNLIKDLRVIAPKKFNSEYSKALKVYLDDTITKLSVFDDLLSKLDLFVEIVNNKLNFKRISVSSEYGVKIVQNDNKELELNKLSSGEQQIIVLYYDLIFGIQNKVVLLIDEPEISLHVAWQRELMNDFNKIIDLKNYNLSIIIATHSPQVINNNWHSIIDLGEQNGK